MVATENSMKHDQPLDTIKILIADDNMAMRHLLRAAITQWGYHVIEARDGEEAWDMMQQTDPPRILIIDWKMPKLDGIALCERIRKNLNFYPYIIFLTQMSGAANIIRGLEAGADEFLLKPVNLTELRTHIFAGEQIIKYVRIIQEQKKQLQDCHLFIKTLEILLAILIEKGAKK